MTQTTKDIENLVEACVSALELQDGVPAYSAAALATIGKHFERLRKGPLVEEATRELLLFAFFLHQEKQAEGAASALAQIATTAAPALRAAGRSVSGVLDNAQARARLKALGLTATPKSKTNVPTDGMSLLELLAGNRPKKP